MKELALYEKEANSETKTKTTSKYIHKNRSISFFTEARTPQQSQSNLNSLLRPHLLTPPKKHKSNVQFSDSLDFK